VFERTGLARRRSGFSPPIDVYYADDPQRVVVRAELAGIDPDELALEIQGRELTLTGNRREADVEGRVYQQLEIEHGPFQRRVQFAEQVDPAGARAEYKRGLLTVSLPVAEREPAQEKVSIQIARSK